MSNSAATVADMEIASTSKSGLSEVEAVKSDKSAEKLTDWLTLNVGGVKFVCTRLVLV